MGKSVPGRPGFLVKALEAIARKKSCSKDKEEAAMRGKQRLQQNETASFSKDEELHCLRSGEGGKPDADGVRGEELWRTAAARLPSHARVRRHEEADAPPLSPRLSVCQQAGHDNATHRTVPPQYLGGRSAMAAATAEWHNNCTAPDTSDTTDSEVTSPCQPYQHSPTPKPYLPITPNLHNTPGRGSPLRPSLEHHWSSGQEECITSPCNSRGGPSRILPMGAGPCAPEQPSTGMGKLLSLRFRKDIKADATPSPGIVIRGTGPGGRPGSPFGAPLPRSPAMSPEGPAEGLQQVPSAHASSSAVPAAPAAEHATAGMVPHPPTGSRPSSVSSIVHVQWRVPTLDTIGQQGSSAVDGVAAGCTAEAARPSSGDNIEGNSDMLFTARARPPQTTGSAEHEGTDCRLLHPGLASQEAQEQLQAQIHHLLLEPGTRPGSGKMFSSRVAQQPTAPQPTAPRALHSAWSARRGSLDSACQTPILTGHGGLLGLGPAPAGGAGQWPAPVVPAAPAAAVAAAYAAHAFANGQPLSPTLLARRPAAAGRFLSVRTHPEPWPPAALGLHAHGSMPSPPSDALSPTAPAGRADPSGPPDTTFRLQQLRASTAGPPPVRIISARSSLDSMRVAMATSSLRISRQSNQSAVDAPLSASSQLGSVGGSGGGECTTPAGGSTGQVQELRVMERRKSMRESLPKREAALLQLLDDEREDHAAIRACSRQAVRNMSTSRRASLEVSTTDSILTVDWKKHMRAG